MVDSILTTAEIQAHIKILPVKHPYLYQKSAQKATELRLKVGAYYTKQKRPFLYILAKKSGYQNHRYMG